MPEAVFYMQMIFCCYNPVAMVCSLCWTCVLNLEANGIAYSFQPS